MSRRGSTERDGRAAERARTRAKPPATARRSAKDSGSVAAPPLSPGRRALFLAITLITPLLLLAAVEGILRLTDVGRRPPLFVAAPIPGRGGELLIANPHVAERWFTTEGEPPGPIPEPFAVTRPAHAFRVFVLGESTTAGFPYPHNVTFSRLIRDVLRDVLPEDSVEVVNLGIAATNSYALLDITDEVIAQHPDAVLIYAGHNEYYGALGVGSTERAFGATRPLVRAYLWLERLRTFVLLRDALAVLRRRLESGGREAKEAPSFMEVLARDQQIALGSPVYRRGARQFERNLTDVLSRFHDAGVPVFVGSLASNLRDQQPFVAAANAAPAGADSAFARAGRALAAGDTAKARQEFVRARDLDVVRFRAPSEFNEIVRRVATATHATYVPVAETFADSSPGRIPGRDLFLEHVHPNQRGYALIAHAFYQALRDAHFLGHAAHPEKERPWDVYVRGRDLTPFDERIALHTQRTLEARWPFVPSAEQRDYRATYQPSGLLDSLAFLVSRGAPWAEAKLALATDYERRGQLDSAIAEYRGLARDEPLFETPLRLLGHALLAANRTAEAEEVLQRALRIQPTAYTTSVLGQLALRRRDLTTGISLLQQSLSLDPAQPVVLYQLSLAYGLAHDVQHARATALRLAQLAPQFPGLAGWLQALETAKP